MNIKKILKEELDNINIVNSNNPSEIFNYIDSLPNKFRVDPKNIEYRIKKLYNNGLNTAMNNSTICKFYLIYFKKSGKNISFIKAPNLNSILYDKLFNIIND